MYVLMIVPNDFPNGDAGAVRDFSFAQIYLELGYEVYLIGKGKGERRGRYGHVEFVSIYKPKIGKLKKIKGIIRYIKSGKSYISEINRRIQNSGLPQIIHINHINEKVINYLIDFAIHNNITIVHDSVEWYSACEFKMRRFDKQYILKNRLNTKLIRNPIKVYAISEYLQNHFLSKGLNTLQIPVIMDVNNMQIEKKVIDNNKLRLIYAGNPANKDYLREIVLAVDSLSETEKGKIELRIYGVEDEKINLLIGKKHSNCIMAYGRVSRDEVLEKLKQSDFSILLRPSDKRYAQAGFPTKVVEAMGSGVAMLCNISSDLGMYLTDMQNAIIVSDSSIKELRKAIQRALCLDRDDIKEIKKNARLTAEKYFDYRNWCESVSNLLE